MKQSERQKQLKAFAKRRDERARSQPAPPVNAALEAQVSQCAGALTVAIVELRSRVPELTDEPVVTALRAISANGEPKQKEDPLWQTLLRVKAQQTSPADVWQRAASLILQWVDASALKRRQSTQLLDLLETVSR